MAARQCQFLEVAGFDPGRRQARHHTQQRNPCVKWHTQASRFKRDRQAVKLTGSTNPLVGKSAFGRPLGMNVPFKEGQLFQSSSCSRTEKTEKETNNNANEHPVLVVATGLLASVAAVPAVGQMMGGEKMGKMSGTNMSHDEMMAKIDKMSTDDKAAAIDKMPAKDKVVATKTSGHDMSKMSTQEKADMFDAMPMDKKMSMMSGRSPMHKGGKMGKGKMDKMGKMGPMDK